jgi:restriction system protein
VREDFGWYVRGAILRASAILRELDPADLATPLNELRRHLLARYGDRFKVHPKRYEDLVGQVFKDFGFEVRVTSYSGDEGIDLFVFDGPQDQVTGVQVKRYKGKIEAEQVRAFTGALFLRGLTAGVFVTTSGFRRGARVESLNAKQRGLPISLWDADRFYSAMKLTVCDPYESPDDPNAPFATAWQSHDGLPLADTIQAGRD